MQASAGHFGPYKKTTTLAARGLASSLQRTLGGNLNPRNVAEAWSVLWWLRVGYSAAEKGLNGWQSGEYLTIPM